jgi:hypothetical protein
VIVGHYAAALVPHSRLEGRPLWLLLVCADVPEFLWLALALTGVEPTTPASLLDATFPNIDVHMTYSHNLVPGLIQGVIVFALVQAIWPDSPQVSLDTYGHAPVFAIAIELVFALGCVYAYLRSEARRGRPLTRGRSAALYAVFVIGILMWLPATSMSLGQAMAMFGS